MQGDNNDTNPGLPHQEKRIKRIHDRLDTQDEMLKTQGGLLKEIHTALIGNPSLGLPGLVSRQADTDGKLSIIEKRVDDHSKKIWLVSVVGSALWASLVAFKEQIFGPK